MSRSLRSPLHRHILAVSAAGLGVLVALVATHHADLGERHGAGLLAMALGVVLAESAPIVFARKEHEEAHVVSTAFSFALLLAGGPLHAVLAQGVASLLADLRDRRPVERAVFNVAQYALALTAAGLVLGALTDIPHSAGQPITPGDLPAIGLAMVVFFVVNHGLVTTAGALASRVRVLPLWLQDLPFQATTGISILGIAPVIVVTGAFTWLLLPLLALPLVAVHRAGRLAALNEHQALHDVLTDLPNRALFRDRVVHALDEARRRGSQVVVLLMDLDRFKEINDTLGHHHGDALLKQVGPRIAAVLRASDTVARLGGDEFAVMLPDAAGAEAGRQIARKILGALEQPIVVQDLALEIGASIGIACAPDHGDDVDALIQRADVAMYVAKEAHSGCELYEPSQDEHTLERLALMGELRRAMDRRELFVVYQPKVELATGELRGAEALVRWAHPQRGLIPPGLFVEHAERAGLVRPLTLFVLDAALEQLDRWRRDGLELAVAVNLSVRSLLDQGLPGDVAALLERWGTPPSALKLEITESTIMADPVRARLILEELHAMGVGLAIDDFGTGYSSLSYLSALPVEELKIDRSFVMAMAANRDDETIVQSTVDLGRNLGLRVVAEGIEDEEVCRRLEALGCHLGQGYHFSRPVGGEELAAWARARAAPTLRLAA